MDAKLEQKIVAKAIQIGSKSLVSKDPLKLSRIAIASGLLGIAGSLSPENANRLINAAVRIAVK